MAWEAYNERWQQGPHRMLPGIVSATAALAVMYPFLGAPFLGVYQLGRPELQVWWTLLAAALGVLGAGIGALAIVALGLAGRAAARVPHPAARALLAGVAVAVIGFTVPMTMFSGRDQLSGVLDHLDSLGLGFLGALLLAKLAAFAISMRWGFFGGPIFPLVFLGAIAGAMVHVAFPSIPLAVAMPSVAAAVAASTVPLPFMVMVLTMMMFGLPLDLAVLPSVAVVTSFVLVQGTGLATTLSTMAAGTGRQ